MTPRACLERWYEQVAAHDAERLETMLHDDVVFISPVLHTPQHGKAITHLYLAAAHSVLAGPAFRYVGEWLSEDGAVLEFVTDLDGVQVNGIDMIRWNGEGLITEFKVMVRPLKGIQAVHALMGRMLQALGPKFEPPGA